MTMRTMTSPRIQSIAAMRVVFAAAPAAASGGAAVTTEAGGVAIDRLPSVGLQAGGPEHLASLFRGLGRRRLRLLQMIFDAELFPLEPAQLVKRQHFDALDYPEAGGELGNVPDVVEVVREVRHEHEPDPDRALPGGEASRERKRRTDLAARELFMRFEVPFLESDHDEIYRLEVGIGQLFAEETVRLDRRVHAHAFGGLQQLQHEAVLHERLAAADGEAARHDLEALTIFAQLFGGLRDADRVAVTHRPGVRVVAIAAAPHAARRPRDDAHPRPVDRRARGQRMQEAHVAAYQCALDVGLRQLLREV